MKTYATRSDLDNALAAARTVGSETTPTRVTLDVATLETTIAREVYNYRAEMQAAQRLLESAIASLDSNGERVSTHDGFNLASKAANLSVAASRIELLRSLLAEAKPVDETRKKVEAFIDAVAADPKSAHQAMALYLKDAKFF